MNVSDINRNQCILKRSIDMAILHSILSLYDLTKKPEEPDYIAALSTIFSKNFFEILKSIFPDYDFSVSSAFCHQKPIVDIGRGERSELGDILFVYKDNSKNGEVKLNSLLLQAKVNRSNYPCLTVHDSDKHQLKLYKKWPEFTYSKAGRLNGEKRNIFPKSINDGAQYLIINESRLMYKWPIIYKDPLIYEDPLMYRCCCESIVTPMYCAVPDEKLFCNESLSNELINLLKFKSGRTFDESSEDTEDDWSKMIWDLFEILGKSCARRKNICRDPFKRWNSYNFYITNDKTMDLLLNDYVHSDTNDKASDDYMHNNINGNVSEDEDSVMSVILIESKPKEQYDG